MEQMKIKGNKKESQRPLDAELTNDSGKKVKVN